jgi:hypothetical protein
MMNQFTVPVAGRIAHAAGTFFRYESAGTEGADQSLRVRADGNDLGLYLPGDALELPEKCSVWELTPVSCSAVIKIGFGRINTVRSTLVGTVSTSVRGMNFWNTPKTVNSGAAQSLVAAGATRAALIIQNKHATGSIWIGNANTVTQADGLRIGPGGYWEWDGSGAVPINQLWATGDVASNADVVVMGAG